MTWNSMCLPVPCMRMHPHSPKKPRSAVARQVLPDQGLVIPDFKRAARSRQQRGTGKREASRQDRKHRSSSCAPHGLDRPWRKLKRTKVRGPVLQLPSASVDPVCAHFLLSPTRARAIPAAQANTPRNWSPSDRRSGGV